MQVLQYTDGEIPLGRGARCGLMVLGILALLLGLLLLAGLAATLFAMARRPASDPLSPRAIAGSCWARYRDEVLAGAAWLAAQPAEEVTVASFDGLRLAGRLLPAENARGVLLLFHGYRSAPQVDFSCAARMYHELGFTLLLADQRAHGRSQGRFLTYGVLERQDCLAWARYAYGRFGDGVPLFLCGLSMGATTVLMAADLPLPPTVRGIVADCGFTSPRDILAHVMRAQYHLPPRLLLPVMDLFARLLAGVRLGQCSTEETLARTALPVQLFHGEADRFVPCEMSRRAYAACAGEKHLLTIPGAGHGASFLVDRAAYTEAVRAFLSSHLL